MSRVQRKAIRRQVRRVRLWLKKLEIALLSQILNYKYSLLCIILNLYILTRCSLHSPLRTRHQAQLPSKIGKSHKCRPKSRKGLN